jgi:hypothetical protein
MNDLSWLLYGADVLNNLGILFLIVGMLLVILAGVFAGPVYTESDNPAWIKHGKNTLIIGIAVLVVSMFMPSKQTMYMIAASEMGEEAIQTPEFQKVRELVNQYLDDSLSSEEE